MISEAKSDGRYETDYRVRFDEAGPDGLLRTAGLLRFTQDLAALHSEALGYDRAWYAARGLTWLVRTAELDIRAAIPYGAQLSGSTRVLGFRRVWSRRESTFALGSVVAAIVRIDWLLIDERGAPARIPPELETIFPGRQPAASLRLGRVDLDEPLSGVTRRTFEVRPQELDPLDHVNNAVYADWVDEAIMAADLAGATAIRAVPRLMRLEYALAAEPGERLETVSWGGGADWACRVRRKDAGVDVLRASLSSGSDGQRSGGIGASR